MSDTWRHRTAIALVAVAGVLVGLSLVVTHLARNVYDSKGFADNGTAVIASDAGRAELTRVIIDELERSNPDLVSLRPLTQAATDSALQSTAFQGVAHEMLSASADAMFRPDEGGAVINIANAVLLARQALVAANPELEQQVPAPTDDVLVTIADGSAFAETASAASRNRALRVLLPIAALALFALGIAMSVDRRRMVGAVGIAVALAGSVIFIGVTIGAAVVAALSPAESAAFIGAVFEAYSGGLQRSSLLAVVAGMIVTAAAVTSVSSIDASSLHRWVLRVFTSRPERKLAAAGQAVVVSLVGIGAILEPIVALEVTAFFIGSWLLFVGIIKLLGLVETGLGTTDDNVSTREYVREWGVPFVGITLALGLLAIIVVPMLITDSDGDQRRDEASLRACNGHVDLCDRRLDEIAMAGTHNSQSNATDGYLNPDQKDDIQSQLNRGYRALLIDTYYGATNDNGVVRTTLDENAEQEFVDAFGRDGFDAAQRLADNVAFGPATGKQEMFLCHGFCEIGSQLLVDELQHINDWLSDNPREVLIIIIQDYVSVNDAQQAFDDVGLLDRVWRMDAADELPTLAEMIDADQRVLVMGENFGGPPSDWYHNGYGSLLQDTPYNNATVESLHEQASCKLLRGEANNPLLLVNSWVAVYPPRQSDSQQTNTEAFVRTRANLCADTRDRMPNIYALNFGEMDDVLTIMDELNGLADPPAGTSVSADG